MNVMLGMVSGVMLGAGHARAQTGPEAIGHDLELAAHYMTALARKPLPVGLGGPGWGSNSRPLARPSSILVRAAGRAKAAEVRCTADDSICIRAENYTEDVCAAIDISAGKAGLDAHFFARLLWQESLFEPSAISPVGAQGIAQFMPSTAQMVGLDDPYNPAKAILASALYLRKLQDGFGNMGLAAIAYNGGENRAANFISGQGGLPHETRNYVQVITGHDALSWRENRVASPDLRLAGDLPFRQACVQLASGRGIRSFAPPAATIRNWGVIVATHPQRGMAQSYATRLQKQMRPILGGQQVVVHRKRLGGASRPVYTAQVGYDSRNEANAFCTRLKGLGGRCIVLKN